MSGSNLIGSLDLFSGATIGIGNITSKVLPIQFQDNVGIIANWTGNPTGTISVQVCNNYNEQVPAGNIWCTLSLGGSFGPSGSAGNQALSLNQLAFGFLRLIYAGTGGAGTINAYVNARQV